MSTKICTSCKIEKPVKEFTNAKRFKDGLDIYCKACKKLKAKSYRPKRKNKIPSKEFAWRKAGIVNSDGSSFTWSDYIKLLSIAENKCQLCGFLNSNGDLLCVDHDHETGLVRFLLCHPCNRGLGLFKDNPAMLQKAADMLLKIKKDTSGG